MKTKIKKLPKISIALFALALLLFVGGGYIGTRAQLTIFSEDYNAQFELDHLAVALVENGDATIADPEKALILPLKQTFEPGRVYEEKIGAKNVTGINEYVRISLKTYWAECDENGNIIRKRPDLDPSLIELYYQDGNTRKAYNDGAWQINNGEATSERRTFYLNKVLKGGAESAPVVNKLRVNDRIIEDMEVIKGEKDAGGKTTYTYKYAYDGLWIVIEADVQSLQTHNVNDAIKSLWGVQNVTVNTATQTVTVKNS
ncbi:MAG: hypothetical protein IJH75_05670 [Mogibacterium sp.]|nr:hypothetical protein [Mogibacterium sp.]